MMKPALKGIVVSRERERTQNSSVRLESYVQSVADRLHRSITQEACFSRSSRVLISKASAGQYIEGDLGELHGSPC